jgi:NodT family efflux transporter outer membrane factor (OMF) lipoprotein
MSNDQMTKQMQSNRATLAALAVLALAGLASCTVGPDYVRPDAVSPGGFANAFPTTQTLAADAVVGGTTRPSTVTAETEPAAAWWTTLHDPQLDKLIARATAGNLNLQKATAQLRQSRAELHYAGAKELPTLGANPQFTRVDSGRNVGLGNLSGGGANAQSSAIITNVWLAGLDASWEIDVFGGQRRRIESAAADYQANVEDRRDMLVSLTAEVARDYLQLRGYQERLRIARNNLKLQQDTLKLTLSLRAAGFNSQLDVSRQKTQVSQTQAAIIPLLTSVSQQEHALATLMGLTPNELAAELDNDARLPVVPAMVSIGLPTDLLRRRPDIRRAERQIASANAMIGVAVADYYPKFSLTGDFGLDATKFEKVFNWESRYFLLDPSISWKLFNFGQTAAQVDQQKAKYQQAVLTYQESVLTALREVEDALVAYSNEQDHRIALAAAVTSAQQSWDISRDQYKQGVIDFLQVLDTQRQLLSAQDELAQSDQAIATNLVALYKALGGGWEDEAARQRRDKPNADVPPAIDKSALLNQAGN